METPKKLNLKELISLFEGRIDEQAVLPQKETLKIDNPAQLKKNVGEATLSTLGALQTTTYENGFQADRPPDENMTRRYKFLHKEKVDGSIPLTFSSMKGLIKEGDNPEEEHLFLNLRKGELPEGDTGTLYRAGQQAWREGREIGNLTLRTKENDFEIIDRLVAPQFREQGFGGLLLNSTEGMVQRHANDTQKNQRLHAETAQLDVICWLWNQGYEPATPKDQEKLDKILTADPDLLIGENLYVFPSNISKAERVANNRKNAFRIRLEKKITPKLIFEIGTRLYVKKECRLKPVNPSERLDRIGGIPLEPGFIGEILEKNGDQVRLQFFGNYGHTFGDSQRWYPIEDLTENIFGVDSRVPEGGNLEKMTPSRANELLTDGPLRSTDDVKDAVKTLRAAFKRTTSED